MGLGEDGPTHQPIEQLASLRAMPGLRLIRPADANETAQAWRVAVDSDGPTGLVLTRQGIPVLEGTAELAPEGLPRGAYVLVEEERRTRRTWSWWEPAVRFSSAWRRPRTLKQAGYLGPGGLVPVLGPVRGPGRRLPRDRCCRPGSPRSRSKRRARSVGSGTSTT